MPKKDMKIDEIKRKLAPIFKKRQVALAYLFDSRVKDIDELCDIKIAVMFSKDIKKDEHFFRKQQLADAIGEVMKNQDIDITNLEMIDDPLFAHTVVFTGEPIFVKNSSQQGQIQWDIIRRYEDTKKLRGVSFAYSHKLLAMENF